MVAKRERQNECAETSLLLLDENTSNIRHHRSLGGFVSSDCVWSPVSQLERRVMGTFIRYKPQSRRCPIISPSPLTNHKK